MPMPFCMSTKALVRVSRGSMSFGVDATPGIALLGGEERTRSMRSSGRRGEGGLLEAADDVVVGLIGSVLWRGDDWQGEDAEARSDMSWRRRYLRAGGVTSVWAPAGVGAELRGLYVEAVVWTAE